jgi:hypothetical protein
MDEYDEMVAARDQRRGTPGYAGSIHRGTRERSRKAHLMGKATLPATEARRIILATTRASTC